MTTKTIGKRLQALEAEPTTDRAWAFFAYQDGDPNAGAKIDALRQNGLSVFVTCYERKPDWVAQTERMPQ